MGLLESVPVVFDGPLGEVLHELVDPYTGESLYDVAYEASSCLLTESYDQNQFENFDYVFPVESHLRNVAVKGVLFPRYRQNTELTKAGYALVHERMEVTLDMYEGIAANASSGGGHIKGKSRGYQGSIKERTNTDFFKSIPTDGGTMSRKPKSNWLCKRKHFYVRDRESRSKVKAGNNGTRLEGGCRLFQLSDYRKQPRS